MFSEIDNIVFPDRCEVIEIVPSQQYVYPIFKNGSTSLHETQLKTKWLSIYSGDIGKVSTPITVYLRDPRERFISGVNTFAQHCVRDNPRLDTDTILYFVKKYLFLNRHYAPQFYWLINLARYSTAPLKFENLSAINQLVTINDRAKIVPPDQNFLETIKNFPWSQLELYFFLDQILIEHIGQTLTFDQIVQEIKQNHKELYRLVFQQTQDIVHVLSKT